MPERAPPQLAEPASQGAAAEADRGVVAIRGGSLRVISYACGVAISLGSAVILVRYLGIVDFGRFVTVTSLIALVGGVTEAGIVAFGIRESVQRTEAERRLLIADLLGLRVALTTVGIACAMVFALAAGYPGVLVAGTAVAGVGLLTQVIADVLGIPLQVELRLGRLAIVDLVRRVAALVLIGALALLGSTVLPFFVVAALAGAVALVVLLRMVGTTLIRHLTFDRARWWTLFAEAVPFAIAVSVGAIYFYVTVIVMSLIASEVETGLFATSFRIIQVALAVPAIALTSVFPLVVRAPGDMAMGAGAPHGKVFDVAIIFGIWLSLSIALAAPLIIDVVAGSSGQGAVSVLQIQAAALTVSFVSASSMFGLLALRRYRPLLVASSAALVFNVALGLILIPWEGARGGAIADVATETLVAIGITIALTRAEPRHGLTPKILPAVLLATAVASLAFLLPAGSVVRVAVATAVYFAILLVAGALPDELAAVTHRRGPVRMPLRGRGVHRG